MKKSLAILGLVGLLTCGNAYSQSHASKPRQENLILDSLYSQRLQKMLESADSDEDESRTRFGYTPFDIAKSDHFLLRAIYHQNQALIEIARHMDEKNSVSRSYKKELKVYKKK